MDRRRFNRRFRFSESSSEDHDDVGRDQAGDDDSNGVGDPHSSTPPPSNGDYDSDDEGYRGGGRKRRFHSTSSSSHSPSPKTSLTPHSSSCERDGHEPSSRQVTVDDYWRSEKQKMHISDSEDLYEYDEEEDDEGWAELPAILLDDIFVMLTPKQRHQASMVCRPWYEIFYSPRVWETFVLLERTLTRRRFNLYKGYQRELCPRKTQVCLMRVGCFFKRIVVTPISDFYNLYEFLRVLASFLGFYTDFPMPLLHTFRFTFACESRGMTGVVIHGTGGKILDELKLLLGNMQSLRHLALNELLLDVLEVPGLLEAAAKQSGDSLHSLELLNCSKVPLAMPEVTQFSQLVKLTLSPQHLSEEVVLLLGGTQLLQLHLLQDAYTCSCEPVSSDAWKLFKEMAPNKRVFLEIQGLTKTPILLQPSAPVRGVVFRTPYHRLTPDLATWLEEYYSKYLEYFVQESLPRAHGSRKFHERADASFLRLIRTCLRLHTLVIRERISLSTLLLIASEGRALRRFIVRENALIKKCEWPRAREWSQEYYRWLKKTSHNYQLAFEEMPVVLKQRWKPSPDRAFKHLRLLVS